MPRREKKGELIAIFIFAIPMTFFLVLGILILRFFEIQAVAFWPIIWLVIGALVASTLCYVVAYLIFWRAKESQGPEIKKP